MKAYEDIDSFAQMQGIESQWRTWQACCLTTCETIAGRVLREKPQAQLLSSQGGAGGIRNLMRPARDQNQIDNFNKEKLDNANLTQTHASAAGVVRSRGDGDISAGG
jgi:hypothetical protein